MKANRNSLALWSHQLSLTPINASRRLRSSEQFCEGRVIDVLITRSVFRPAGIAQPCRAGSGGSQVMVDAIPTPLVIEVTSDGVFIFRAGQRVR